MLRINFAEGIVITEGPTTNQQGDRVSLHRHLAESILRTITEVIAEDIMGSGDSR